MSFTCFTTVFMMGGQAVVGDTQAYESMYIERRPFFEAAQDALTVVWIAMSEFRSSLNEIYRTFLSFDMLRIDGQAEYLNAGVAFPGPNLISALNNVGICMTFVIMLAVFPLPGFDGWRFFRTTLEAVTRREVPRIAIIIVTTILWLPLLATFSIGLIR